MSEPVEPNSANKQPEQNQRQQGDQQEVPAIQPNQAIQVPKPAQSQLLKQCSPEKQNHEEGQQELNEKIDKKEQNQVIQQNQKKQQQGQDKGQKDQNLENKVAENPKPEDLEDDDGQNCNESNREQEDLQNSKQIDDQGKSVISGRKDSSGSIRESQIENDTSQLQVGGGAKKCFNKLCPSKKIFKKIRSRVQAQRYRFLCKQCYENYFCQQIYSNYQNEDEDMHKWVGCDKCERWNHIECQRSFRDKNFEINKNTHYQCLSCSKKGRSANSQNFEHGETQHKRVAANHSNKQQRLGQNESRSSKPKLQLMKQDRIPIFYKRIQPFPCLEPFLASYNFRIWINENLIRDDIEVLRQLNKRPPVQDQPKKTKKVKQE